MQTQAAPQAQSLPHPMADFSDAPAGSSMDDAVEIATKILGGQEAPSDQEDNQPQAEPGEVAPEPEQPDAENAEVEGADAKDSDTQETEAVFELPIKGEDGQPLKVTEKELLEWRDNGYRQADYTRKTQALQERVKEFDAEREQIRSIAVNTVKQYTSRLAMFDAAVQRLATQGFENVNWDRLATENPEEYNRLFPRFQQQVGKAQQILAAIHQEKAQTEAQLRQQEEMANRQAEEQAKARVPEALAELQRAIPNWSDEYYGQLMNYAVANKFDPQHVAKSVAPNEFVILHKAYQYDLSQKRLPQVKKIAAAKPLPPVSKPGTNNPGSVPDKRSDLVARVRSTGSKDDATAAISAILNRR